MVCWESVEVAGFQAQNPVQAKQPWKSCRQWWGPLIAVKQAEVFQAISFCCFTYCVCVCVRCSGVLCGHWGNERRAAWHIKCNGAESTPLNFKYVQMSPLESLLHLPHLGLFSQYLTWRALDKGLHLSCLYKCCSKSTKIYRNTNLECRVIAMSAEIKFWDLHITWASTFIIYTSSWCIVETHHNT